MLSPVGRGPGQLDFGTVHAQTHGICWGEDSAELHGGVSVPV